MKPSTSTSLATTLIAFPIQAVLIHWIWSSWIVSIVGVSLPWLQAFVIAFFTAELSQVVLLLERIADMMWEAKEQRTLRREKGEERRWDSPLV